MLFSIAVTLLFLSFFASVVFTGYFRNIAKSNNFLIDIPDKSRSFHFRSTPLVGGLGIQASILLSSLFMISLIDYKYDFQLGESNAIQPQSSFYSETSFSKKINIKNENNGNSDNYRFDITPIKNNEAGESYLVNLGSSSQSTLNITKINKDTFSVSLPNGQIKIFRTTGSEIIEIDKQGNQVGDLFKIDSQSEKFFSLSIFVMIFIIMAIFLQLFTLFDDAYGIGPIKRIFAQSIAALIIILVSDVYLEDLKISLMGVHFNLGLWGIPFTVFAVVGITNAFNMIDGINGLCAGFALIALIALQIASGFDVANYALVTVMGSLIGFLFYNLGFLGKKRRVFLGDNGSTFLGFLVAWTCINFSQSTESLIKPVTCLWIVAIPLLDCLGVTIRRMVGGIYPFKAGNDHIHHKLQKLTQNSSRTLLNLLGIGAIIACVGVIIDKSNLSSEFSLILFVTMASVFYIYSSRFLDPIKNN